MSRTVEQEVLQMSGLFDILPRFLSVMRSAALAGVVCVFATASSAATSPGEKRVALVIGNGAYESALRLDNAVFDATAVAGAFRELGFQVVDGYDLDITQMRAKVSEFSAALPDATSAVIYYAGHGISVDEENYLIPTDIVLKSPTDLDLNAISVSLLLKQMKRDERVNVIILDACRDNPFAAELAKHKTRAIVGERGLSRIDGDLARGTLIAFASDPKSTALDGPPGQHSPFTTAFLAHVSDPGVSIDTVMSRVRNDVWEKTHHNQLPWVNTSLIGEYTLNPRPSPESAGATAQASAFPNSADDGRSQENLMWESAQHSNLAADYQAYLGAFPAGIFAQMARNRIANLQPAGASGPARVPDALAMREPAGPSEKGVKPVGGIVESGSAETGTAETERTLNLRAADQKEVQQRLTLLAFYAGPSTGTLDDATRSALAEWQKKRGFASTSFLDAPQLAALRADSENEYQKYLAAKPSLPSPPRKAIIRQSPKPSVTRAAKAPSPVRHLAKESSRAPAAVADNPAPVTASDPGGSPAWRRRAGLPELPSAPDWGGRPPGFWTGSRASRIGGFLEGGSRY
jgi:uncharacterized caspase-like protein